jgi:hypothetical protein
LAKQKDALQRGRDLINSNTDPELIAAGTGRLSQDEIMAQKLGVSRAITDKLRAGNPRAVNRALTNNELLQERLTRGLNDPQAAQALIDAAKQATESETKYQAVLSGSRTTPLAEDINDINAAPGEGLLDHAIAVAQRRIGGQSVKNQALQHAVNYIQGFRHPALGDPAVTKAIADVLVGSKSREEALAALERAKFSGKIPPEVLTGVKRALLATAPARVPPLPHLPPMISTPSLPPMITGAAAGTEPPRRKNKK